MIWKVLALLFGLLFLGSLMTTDAHVWIPLFIVFAFFAVMAQGKEDKR